MAIPAHFQETPETEGRPRDPRRTLSLEVSGAMPSGAMADVLVHNISATGLLLESRVALDVGEKIEIDLPHAGATLAKVIWASEQLFGCQFHTPVSDATLSAAQLRSAVEQDVEIAEKWESMPDESFGMRLQRLRKERRISLSQIADQLGVSKPTVWAWEHDKTRPLDSRIDALADVLGVSASELKPGMIGSDLRGLLARSRETIAEAVGTSPAKIKIMIEL